MIAEELLWEKNALLIRLKSYKSPLAIIMRKGNRFHFCIIEKIQVILAHEEIWNYWAFANLKVIYATPFSNNFSVELTVIIL